MTNNGHKSHRRHIRDYALVAMEQMELYCEAHPRSPSAVRQPRLFVRGELWIALLGPNVEEGIVGIGLQPLCVHLTRSIWLACDRPLR